MPGSIKRTIEKYELYNWVRSHEALGFIAPMVRYHAQPPEPLPRARVDLRLTRELADPGILKAHWFPRVPFCRSLSPGVHRRS
jgi:hypothetical protein